MALTSKQRADFNVTVKALRDTETGKEATMYSHLRDLFIDLLGYPKTNATTDTAGKRGRPDVTFYAPGGNAGSRIDWIVVDAKDEKGAVSGQTQRLQLFAEKAKYIASNTAYFVMADPDMLVARGAGLGKQAEGHIEVKWDGLAPEKFLELMAPSQFAVCRRPYCPHALSSWRRELDCMRSSFGRRRRTRVRQARRPDKPKRLFRPPLKRPGFCRLRHKPRLPPRLPRARTLKARSGTLMQNTAAIPFDRTPYQSREKSRQF